ncbi:sugar ABC transporter ATP-binding protein [Stieleria varia]|uniref:Ribose import ATP-binding protein RbsA n=1 Tax=Stieleria varia TaxID=2528005 RepID=A0A5C6B267_9BACT|nr:sugar ABC transporter ATP-binding protein [Stieleria varia]TWU06223.1 Ribose import ATP-binding protein RbsA [Stieleria varia]
MQTVLRLEEIVKRYGSVTVLDRVSLDVRCGEIHALLGANGAGKSTLCKIISGLITATSGRMELHGDSFAPAGKQAAEHAGVQIVQQELNQVATLSVAENILLNRLPAKFGVIDRKTLDARARQALDRFGLDDVDTEAIMGGLGVGRQQMVEIATALDRQCQLLILDEPTAALSVGETDRLFERLHQLRRDGVAIIYISHRLDEVAQMADRVTVLRDGKVVTTQDAKSLTTDQMVQWMSGVSSQSADHSFETHRTDERALAVDGLTGGMVDNVTFEVARGERLGIAGLVGSGRTELIRLIFGADVASSGSVSVGTDGSPTTFKHPKQAVAAGLAMVTEDRKQNGLLLSQSIRMNSTICALGKRFSTGGIILGSREIQATEAMIDSLDTQCNDIDQAVRTLSGGNQQKVAVAKWLIADAEILFFDEPTRGIDVAARNRLYDLFESLAKQGKAIVIVSSDLDELTETCDRIGVMSAGKWVTDFERGHWTDEAIMQAAFSQYRAKATNLD